MTRLLRLVAAALLLALVAFLFAGCGGGDSTTAATTKTSSKSSTAAAKVAASSTELPESMVGQVVVPTDQTPDEFTKSIENRRPILVLFYMAGTNSPSDDSDVRTEVSALENRYKGQVDFYDYSYTDADRYKDLSTILKVNTTPTVVVIKKQAVVQRAWTGFVDEKSISQGIQEALQS
jgi:thioredoxin-like negative regulator of GroEL